MTSEELVTVLAQVEEERAQEAEDGRTLLIRLFRWGEVADTAQGREAFPRGSLDGVDPATILIESSAHGGAIVGRGMSIEDDGVGPLLRARVSRTSSGDDLLTLIRDRVLRAASVAFRPVSSRARPDGTIERVKADLRRVAILPAGAYPSAQVLAVRSADMTEPTPPTPTPEPEPPEPVRIAGDLLGPVYQRFDALEESLARVAATGAYGPGRSSTLERFSTFGDAFMVAAQDPEVAQELHRALADNILNPNNPGLNAPSWLGRVVDRVSAGRPAVTAFGAESPGDSGMTVNWPVFDTTSTFHVDEQDPEKEEIATGTTKYKVGTVNLKTIAGGSDNSLALLERSTPAFRDLLLRNYGIEYAKKADALMVAALLAGGTAFAPGLALDGTTDANATAALKAFFAASALVEAATGLPADVALASTDVFIALGGASGLMPSAYGTVNAAGTAQASTLTVNVSGLNVVHEAGLPSSRLIIGQSDAATFFEDGPSTIEALNVSKLGRDIAIYGFVAPVVLNPGGVQIVTVDLVPGP